MAKKLTVKIKDKKDKKDKLESKELTAASLQASAYSKMLDQVEKDIGISSEDMHDNRLSTGTLAVDLILGGGMRNGMMTLVGVEGGGKSTQLLEIMSYAVKQKIPLLELQDAEGTLSPVLTKNIMRVNSMPEIFGKRQDGKWIVDPKIRYYDDNLINSTYDRIARTLNRIPDKVYRPDLGQWFFVVDPTDKKLANFNAKTLGDPYTKLSQKDKLWFPTDNPYPQGIIGIDSYPLLLPDGIDDDEESSKALAQQARAYSQNLPRVVGKLRRKHVLIVGTNQIRENPGARFQDPRYEPAGSALRYNCMTASTLLFTEQGIIPAASYKGDCEIASKDKNEASKNFGPMGVKNISKLTLKNGLQIEASADHAVYTYNSSAKGLEYKKLSELTSKFYGYVGYKIGSEIWSQKEYIFDNKDFITPIEATSICLYPKKMDEKLARLLGFLVGDGSIKEGFITYTTSHKKEIKEVMHLMQLVFGIECNYRKIKKAYSIGFHNIKLGGWLRRNGFEHYGRDKDIPACILQSSKKSIMAFLSGLIDADGSSHKHGVQLHSISHKLISKSQLILHNAGIDTVVSNLQVQAFGKTYDRKIYGLRIKNVSVEDFFNTVPVLRLNINKVKPYAGKCFDLPKMNGWRGLNPQVLKWLEAYPTYKKLTIRKDWFYSKLDTFRTCQQRNSIKEGLDKVFEMIEIMHDGIRWDKIVKTQHNLTPEMTYDGTMPISHTIITNGIISHNSSVRSWYTSRNTPDEWQSGPKKNISEEPSVEGRGTDRYAWKHVANKKCKWGTPFLETWIRIWISDHKGDGRGIDPVLDTFMFLQEVGLASRVKSKGQNQVVFVKGDHPFSGKTLDWLDFKTLILAEEFRTSDLKEKAARVYKKHNINKPYMIRKSCYQLLSTGKASAAMTDNRTKKLELKALKSKSMDDDLEN